MKSNNFREQVSLMTSWFKEWNECEQTVALYSLLKKSSPVQAFFLDQVLQQSLAECSDVKQLEIKANDEAYILSLQREEKEAVTHQLLRLLPLLQVGQTQAKKAYLQLIPELLSHTMCKGVNVEESRQLLSYSLIHPAITTEERGSFQAWMGSLDDRFTTHGGGSASGNLNNSNNNNINNPNNGGNNAGHQTYHHHHHLHCGGSSSSSSMVASSSSVGGSSSSTSTNSNCGSSCSNNHLTVSGVHCHSPSPAGSSSQHSLALASSPDISASQESINNIVTPTNLTVAPPPPPLPQPPVPMASQSAAPPLSAIPQQNEPQHPPSSLIGGSGTNAPNFSWNSSGNSNNQHGLVGHPPVSYPPGGCDVGAAAITPSMPNQPSPSSIVVNDQQQQHNVSTAASCAQPGLMPNNGHLTLRAANSHAGAFSGGAAAAPHGHIPLHATSSAPSKFASLPPQGGPSQGSTGQQQSQLKPNTHAPLQRTQSVTPPVTRLQNPEKTVSDWLKSSHGLPHFQQYLNTPASSTTQQLQQQSQLALQNMQSQQPLQLQPPPQHHHHPVLAARSYDSSHAPLSPQSSVSSSGSGGSDHLLDEGPQPTKDSFLEPGSGMREVPVWLKSLRLHKYSYLFKQLSYEEMLGVTEEMLEQQNVTKGARHKIYVSIVKLRERQEVLRQLEKSIVQEGGSIKSALAEMKNMLNSPIKASSSSSTSLSSGPQSPSSSTADDVQEGDLPAQFCRLMGKICTQLLTASTRDDACFQLYLQLIDKCLHHEAFMNQRKLMQSWKQSAQKIWQPPPQKYGDKQRRFGNAFPIGTSLGSRIIPRAGRGPVPLTSGSHHNNQQGGQVPPGCMQHWSFGSKRSILGSGGSGGVGGGHMPVQRNSSLNAPFINKPGLLEHGKQTLSRTHSAPTHGPLSLALQGCDADTEINARLDSLCESMTGHVLGSSDNNDCGSNY